MKNLCLSAGALSLALGLAAGCTPPAADNQIKIGWVCDETGTDPEAPCDVEVSGTAGVVTDVVLENSAFIHSLTINEHVRQTDIFGSLDIINIGGDGTLEVTHGAPDPIVSEINASGTSETRLNMGRFEAISMVDSAAICMADFMAGNSQVIGPLALSDDAVFVMNNGLFPMTGEDPVEVHLTGDSRAVFWGLSFGLTEAGLGGCTWDEEPDGETHSPLQEFIATAGTCQISGVSKEFKDINFVVTLQDNATLKLVSALTVFQDCATL